MTPAVAEVEGHDVPGVGEHVDVPEVGGHGLDGHADPRLHLLVQVVDSLLDSSELHLKQ